MDGDDQAPVSQSLLAIAQALGVSPNSFFATPDDAVEALATPSEEEELLRSFRAISSTHNRRRCLDLIGSMAAAESTRR